jgi:ribonucleoside-diphosphate reductase alpha chain
MMSIYAGAWERGVKTTYYLHMKPRHTAEQSTVRVNKAETIEQGASARRGFGAGAPQPAAAGSAPAPAPASGRRGFGGLGSPNRD